MMNANSLGAAIAQSCTAHAEKTALMYKSDGAYRSTSYRELGLSASVVANELLDQGINPGDRVALISANRPEWAMVDIACLTIGAVLVPIYTSLSSAQVQYIVQDSGASILFAENERLAAKARELKSSGELKSIYLFEHAESSPPDETHLQVLLEQKKGKTSADTDTVLELRRNVERDELATIIYTSGTTGLPKGVMLTHGNLLANMEGVMEILDIGPGDVMLSLLPLAHVFERLAGHFLPLSQGATVAYAQSPRTVAKDLMETRPTLMLAVPRFYEKMQARIEEAGAKGSIVKRKIFNWAVKTGKRSSQRSRKPHSGIRYSLADRLVFSKLKERTGGRLRFFVSGGAALPADVAKFFYAAGILIIEGYGLTESSPVLNVNRLDNFRFGTVGQVLPNVEIKIAADGEILAKGPNVMQGYLNLPKETRATFSEDGFLRTGDLGRLDEDGFLTITGRKKEIMVTSSGRNIAPTPIENLLKSSPYIAEVMLVADTHPYVTALIVPDFERLEAEGIGEVNSSGSLDPADLVQSKQVLRLIEFEINRLSAGLAEYERIVRFTLMPREFSIEDGELTPTLKVRREVVLEKYAQLIGKMYKKSEKS